MSDTSSRLLKLLSLLQAPREWPGSELAGRLQVSRRTIRRDVERLRDLGYPVEATMGAGGGYRLVSGTAMPPLLLDDGEAVAIAVGLATAARHPVHGIREASVRALAKLEQVLPSRLRYRVRSLNAAVVPLPAADGPGVDPGQLTTLAAAIAGRERVRFGYQARDGPAAPAWPTRTGSSRQDGAGTCSPTTTTARTGGPSASTGSGTCSRRARGSRHATRPPTRPPTSPVGSTPSPPLTGPSSPCTPRPQRRPAG